MSDHSFDVVILTDDRYVHPQNPDTYVRNILKEEEILSEALVHWGYRVTRKSWSDSDFDWTTTRSIIFRSTWDYFDRFDEWKKWLEKVAEQTLFINSHELVMWNMDKHYLGDLRQKGLNIPEIHYIEQGAQTSLATLFEATGWQEVILKPCISGAARHTYRFTSDEHQEYEDRFQALIGQEAMMLQPFQHNVLQQGEVSIMVMDGRFTHAVLKIAKPGDFRVQDDFGGTVHPYHPNAAEIAFAEKAVSLCQPQPLYARVDIICDNQGELAVIEMELIEPELWFRMAPDAAKVLAQGIDRIFTPARQ